MTARYVVATDLSLAARKGAQVAAALAQRTGACLDFICAVPRERLSDEAEEGLMETVRERVAELVREFGRKDLTVSGRVVIVTDVARAIVSHAQKLEAAVFLAPQGATGWKKLVFGSVTEQVLRLAPEILVIARPAKPMPPRNVLAAIDRSPGAARALRHAVEIAVDLEAHLDVLWVLPPPGARIQIQEALDSAEDYKRKKAREKKASGEFHTWVGGFVPDWLPFATRVEEGDAPHTILTQARLTKSSLIVMGMHSRSRAQELFVGSVARAVATAAPVSVMLVRDRPKKRKRKQKAKPE
jgi:nucleotide-binding universal stress UspA family protein